MTPVSNQLIPHTQYIVTRARNNYTVNLSTLILIFIQNSFFRRLLTDILELCHKVLHVDLQYLQVRQMAAGFVSLLLAMGRHCGVERTIC